MKIPPRVFFMLFLGIIFAGCATTGQKYYELDPSLAKVPPEKGRIYVYRKFNLVAFGPAIDIYINNKMEQSLLCGEFFYVDKDPGIYDICTLSESGSKISISVEKGGIKFVRINLSADELVFIPSCSPQLIGNKFGEYDIRDCRYIGK